MTLPRVFPGCALASVVLSLLAQPASAASPDEQWRWSITPYLWLPTINGKFRFDLPPESGTSVGSEIGPSDYLTDLNGVLMLAAELRHDEWAFIGDLIWLDLTADTSRVNTVTGGGDTITIPRETNLDTSTDLSGLVASLVGSRTLSESETFSASALAGARWLTIDADLDWELTTTITGPGFTFGSEGTISGDTDSFDVVVGLRGKLYFGDGGHWYAPWYADIGTGSSDVTWQVMAGVGYTFSRASVLGVWRHLDYDRDDDDFLRELSLGGPGIGFSWRF
jgi:hypothetical protein